MHRWAQASAFGAAIALAMACEHETAVQRQTRELERAQKEAPQVTARLEKDLAGAKGDVARLEKKVALARQGLTDDVLENQQQLELALKEQQQQVQSQISAAQHEAETYGRETVAARRQLDRISGAPPPPTPGTPPPAAATAQPPAPGTAPEPVRPDEVVRVHGVDPDAGARQQTTPPAATPPASAPPASTPPASAPPASTPPASAPPASAPPAATATPEPGASAPR